MKEYNNLINALQSFEESWLFDLGFEGCKASLLRQKDNCLIDINALREEYFDCLSIHGFNWKELATKACLFSDIEIYNNWEIRSIIEFYLNDFFCTNNAFSPEQQEGISSKMISILQDENDWVHLKDLLGKLNIDFPSIKAYHLFNYKDFFNFDLQIRKQNIDKLWIIDYFKLQDTQE